MKKANFFDFLWYTENGTYSFVLIVEMIGCGIATVRKNMCERWAVFKYLELVAFLVVDFYGFFEIVVPHQVLSPFFVWVNNRAIVLCGLSHLRIWRFV